MKTIITIVLLSAGLIYSQTVSDSTQTKQKNQEREKVQTQNQEMNKAQNQIGSKEKAQTDVKENRKRKDVFIDKDGDGICDTRQSGMSFNKMRKRMGAGKQGPGGKGSGGNQNGNSPNWGN
ncbi:MAG: hypothetical protein IPJ23_15625 [Ignavibacteriales bacterium]|nr:hypothetical protein [Ignavibacteriales bacterium]MBK7632103.1 hypothetical protein [Ignavibacteriales bacterium]